VKVIFKTQQVQMPVSSTVIPNQNFYSEDTFNKYTPKLEGSILPTVCIHKTLIVFDDSVAFYELLQHSLAA
jgi:hypothetical protein